MQGLHHNHIHLKTLWHRDVVNGHDSLSILGGCDVIWINDSLIG